MNNKAGVIYILTNPSFPEYVKIGYADDVDRRLKELNRSECIPFAFRLYAYYEVATRLSDIKIHEMIDNLNPELRSIDDFEGKKRVREFYAMTAEDAYSLLESIATINGLNKNLHKVNPNIDQAKDEEEAETNRELAKNRHHFKGVEFHSKLTNKDYYSTTNDDGTLGIYDKVTNKEIPNNNTPSKRKILMEAVEDYGGDISANDTSYELEHKLEKIILGDKEN
jgi:hypothetical protein